MENFYNTLGVNENANPDEIKRAYRKLANQHHPDRGGDTAKFQEIQRAYETLSDDQRRQQYDMQRNGMGGFPGGPGFHFNVNGQPFGGGNMDDIFRTFGFSFGQPGGDPFAQFRQQPKRNKDMRIEIHMDLAETLTTQNKTIEVRTSNGKSHTVDVTIPRGIHHGSSIKYPGLGDNFFESLPRGDLYVNFIVRPNPKFEVQNIDLFTGIDIDCLRAIIGCEQEYQTLDGRTYTITIPPGTQAGTRFRVANQGLYVPNQNNRGSLYLVANITVPVNLDSKTLETIQQLVNTK